MPPALAEIEGDDVAADLAHQVSQQGGRQPFPVRQVGAVLAHDGRQGAQIPFAGHHRSHHGAPPGQRYSGCADLAIRRSSDGGDEAGSRTLASDRKGR